MISERQAAVSKAELSPAKTRRTRALRRWPLLWMLSGAVLVSLALWAGIFVIAGAVIDLVRGF